MMAADEDEVSTSKNIKNFWKHLELAKGIQFKNLNSKQFPRKKIGHFGYFKKENKPVWELIEGALSSFQQ